MASAPVRVKLGQEGDKTYYWNVQTNSLEWSVPDPRSAIRAEDGYVILAADYSQIEVKLMAYASGDPILIEAINSGQDVHSFNAAKVFGARYGFDYETLEYVRENHAYPEGYSGSCKLSPSDLVLIRSRVKTVTFGVPYGAGPTRVALMTGMSIDEARAFIEEFFNTFRVLKQWLVQQGLLAEELGYSCSPRGRKRFYTIPNPDDPDAKELLAQIKRWAGNMPIQAGNADILKVAMRSIYLAIRGGSFIGKKLYDARFLLVVHDEIVMVVRKDHAPAVKLIMAKCMNDAYHTVVPRYGEPGWIALGPEKDGWGVKVVEADIWAKA